MIVRQSLHRPELTMPEAEAERLRAAYQDAAVILEFGSGGSTVMAAEMPGKTVVSVESDWAWARKMRNWFEVTPPADGSSVNVHWCDIGPTKEWGYPSDESKWRRFARYPLEVWQASGFVQPDVVLVDGRFRLGCALATAFMTKAPVTLLFDDYVQREHYHKVEQVLGPPTLTGRMAEWHVTPQPIPPERLMWLVRLMQTP